jgi:hypothetical protein
MGYEYVNLVDVDFALKFLLKIKIKPSSLLERLAGISRGIV